MKKLNYLLLFTALVMLFASCQRSEMPLNNVIPVSSTAKATITGTINDENGNPVANAEVLLGENKTTTNIEGVFVFKNVLTKSTSTVRVKKQGYFEGSRTLNVSGNAYNYVYIDLLPKTVRATFDVTQGGNATFEGISIDIPANGVMHKNGTPYNGTVKLVGAYLSPDADNLGRIMPGNMTAVNARGGNEVLETFGMVAVELLSPSGEILQIASGKKANLAFTLPASKQATAPTSMPLWFYDEEAGIWREEGVLNKNGNELKGEVAHFTFWNADLGILVVQIDGRFQMPNGAPLSGYEIQLTSIANNDKRYGYTNSLGNLTGYVPKNADLIMEVIDNCGGVIYTTPFGPFATPTNFGTMTVPVSVMSGSIDGVLLNCNNQPVSGAQIEYSAGANGMPYTTYCSPAGLFSIPYTNCNQGNMLIKGIATTGFGTNQMTFISPIHTVPLTQGVTNMGNINIPVGATMSITGTVKNSQDQLVTSGVLEVKINGKSYFTAINNGSYSIGNLPAASCNAGKVQVTAFDISGAELEQSLNSEEFNVNAGVNTLPSIRTVFPVQGNYLAYKVDNFANIIRSNFLGTIDPSISQSYVSGNVWTGNTTQSLSFKFAGTIVGQRILTEIDFTQGLYHYNTPSANFFTTVSQIGNIGQPIQGNFNGSFVDQATGVSHTIFCKYKVPRNF